MTPIPGAPLCPEHLSTVRLGVALQMGIQHHISPRHSPQPPRLPSPPMRHARPTRDPLPSLPGLGNCGSTSKPAKPTAPGASRSPTSPMTVSTGHRQMPSRCAGASPTSTVPRSPPIHTSHVFGGEQTQGWGPEVWGQVTAHALTVFFGWVLQRTMSSWWRTSFGMAGSTPPKTTRRSSR